MNDKTYWIMLGIGIIFLASIWIGIGYVAFHFISKYW